MKDTQLKATDENLCILVIAVASKAAKELLNVFVGECKSWRERVELLMECYYTYDQKWIIVKIVETGTWGLIEEKGDPDNKEYIRLSNSNKIIDWFI